MSIFNYVTIFLWIIYLKASYCRAQKINFIDCDDKNVCSECIQTNGCAWCSKVKQKVFADTRQISRCYSSVDIKEMCDEAFVENPKSFVKILSDQEMKNGLYGDSIQIRPQELYIAIKPGEEYTIDIHFKKAENYPVDLYYLMDFSSSMSKYKNSLSKLGNELAETMKNLTNNFQLGFGSFVDKVVLPYASTLPSHLQRPCPKCRSPYSFKNHMSLTRETQRFSVEVQRAQMSGNIDTPEGVLDALMQVMVCHKILNWRDKARHIIVVSTDAPFHLAGDGKLGGVVEPNDGMCYVNSIGEYTHFLTFDYPSVSQISHKALENNMNIIFAVVNKVKSEYLSLSREIRGASLGLLDGSQNIAQLIKAQYEKITTTVRLTDNAREPIKISYSAFCAGGREWKNTNACANMKGGSEAHFKAHISASSCSEKYNKQIIKIKPIGINESLVIHLEIKCQCECSLNVNHKANEINSKHCSFSGNLICGKCLCQKGKIGKNCECDGNNKQISNITDTRNCIPNNLTHEICSGRGDCVCGICQCHPRKNPKEEVTGKFCECDNFSCEKSYGVMCSGHGSCKCGKCVCESGWTGETCDCFEDTSPCRTDDGNICFGKGKCVCGVCHCNNGTEVDENRYSGKYCQICLTCHEQCDSHNDCVECLSYNSGPLVEKQCGNCSNKFEHELIENVEDVEQYNEKTTHLCISADQSGCTFKYIYYYNEDQLIVKAEKDTQCPKKVNLIAIIASTIGSTVLIGLLSIVAWRILIDIHDLREYQKFERERNLASWAQGGNPLFKTATSTYQNPTYQTDSL